MNIIFSSSLKPYKTWVVMFPGDWTTKAKAHENTENLPVIYVKGN